MAVVRIEVRDFDTNTREHKYARAARNYLDIQVFGSEEVQLFWLNAEDNSDLPKEDVQTWADKVFCDPVLQEYATEYSEFRFSSAGPIAPTYVAQVRFLAGVTDNVGKTATDALNLLGGTAKEKRVKVYTGKAIYLYGDISKGEAERLATEVIANPLIEDIQVFAWKDYDQPARFENQKVLEVHISSDPSVEVISLDVEDRVLEKMSKERCWALSGSELQTIVKHFSQEDVKAKRKLKGLDSPTDVEMEVIAQTWSEHCKHKIFNAEIDYEEANPVKNEAYPAIEPFTVKSVFKSYIRKVTEDVRKERNLPWLVSVFTDNAGVVRFDPNIDLCIKVETHNSPSALDPYGGALTGIVGVNRDILGCGLGARPIANTDVFCFGPPDWPAQGDEKELPEGLKHPRRIFDGVHLGVEDGGNKSGIPTVNGAFAFHRDFSGKPLVFCGTIGVMPAQTKAGLPGSSKNQKPGDYIVMAGGRIGKDGIHGATFSSMELTEGAPATVVQIGDPITQKRLADFLLEARDLGLYSSVTDNGAGGLSSSVGEMATGTHGARLDVTNVPVKYPGLQPYELVVSESQERMTFSVPQNSLEAFMSLARKRGVEASVVGEFNDSGFFEVVYAGKTVAYLDLDFLHDGLPPMILKAKWEGPKEESKWTKPQALPEIKATEFQSRAFHEQALKTLLARWNIRSKEDWVRRYDHEVQASTLVKPFVGVGAIGPGDAAVVWLAPHGGDKKAGVTVSCGLQPKLARFDAYVMAQHSLDEAVRNSVATGGDPDQLCLIDNFCWPDPLPSERNPDAQHKLAQLVRANKGLYDLAKIYGAPFVSGKDSMKNDFIGRSRLLKDIKISIPPTVLVTAMAKVHDVSKTVTSDFQVAGDKIFIVGKGSKNLGGSELAAAFDLPEGLAQTPPAVDGKQNLLTYRSIHKAMQMGLVRSCHDCSEGGLMVALAESAIGGRLGVQIDIDNMGAEIAKYNSLSEFLYNEASGRFVVSVSPENESAFVKAMSECEMQALGTTTQKDVVRILRHGLVLLDLPVSELTKVWRGK